MTLFGQRGIIKWLNNIGGLRKGALGSRGLARLKYAGSAATCRKEKNKREDMFHKGENWLSLVS